MSRVRDLEVIYEACRNGDALSLKRLKKAGFKFSIMDQRNNTLLHYAAEAGNLETAQ
jgi:ankyrin repeat protein